MTHKTCMYAALINLAMFAITRDQSWIDYAVGFSMVSLICQSIEKAGVNK